MNKRRNGFTIIELLIAVVVAGTLLMLALPSFKDQLRKARRADGVAALAALQQAQEQWRSTVAAYAPNGQLTTGLKQSVTSSQGYYTVSIATSSATGYTASATGASGTSQADDGTCSVLWVRMESGNLSYGSGASPDWTDAKHCWAR